MITIDGSQGEGGGQILRTSLALSLVTGQPFKVTNIRAGRSKPGLMRQHLTAVEAACKVGDAECEGASIGSGELIFRPGKVKSGHYQFSVGTAGSVTLVLQTILPALLNVSGESTLELEGGTHNPFAPPWDFLAKAFLQQVNKMGPEVSTTLVRPGFYPAGGGRFNVSVKPVEKLMPLELNSRGEIKRRSARAIVSNLPLSIAHRELKTISEYLNWSRDMLFAEDIKSSGPGNVIIIEIESESLTEVFTGFGERGVSAETVAKDASKEARDYLVSNSPVGIHLADQLMIPIALAGKGSYLTMPLTLHSRTNMQVIRMFLDIRICEEKVSESQYLITFG